MPRSNINFYVTYMSFSYGKTYTKHAKKTKISKKKGNAEFRSHCMHNKASSFSKPLATHTSHTVHGRMGDDLNRGLSCYQNEDLAPLRPRCWPGEALRNLDRHIASSALLQ